MSNSSGSYRTTIKNFFAAFDKLPPTARKTLAEAAFDYAPQPFLTKWQRGTPGYKTGPDIAAKIRQLDKTFINQDRHRVWGIVDEKATSRSTGRKRKAKSRRRRSASKR